MRSPAVFWLLTTVTYLFLIMCHGYRFGDIDMTETLSYALYLADRHLYAQDLYIQAVASSWLNERYPFALLLRLFGDYVEWGCFILHLTSSVLLITGLLKIAERHLSSAIPKLLFLIISLIILYHINLGENEIWYNYFVPSHLAKAIGVWSIYFFIMSRPKATFATAAISSLAQPVVGAQLCLLYFSHYFFRLIFYREKNRDAVLGFLFYCSTAGVWIATIFIHHLIADTSIDGNTFYKLMETRLAHHFFPGYYPLRSYAILLPLFAISAFLFRKSSTKLFHFFSFSFAGMFLYFIGIEWLEISPLLSVQWFKITVWLKPLSILAVIMFFEKIYKEKILHRTNALQQSLILGAVVITCGATAFWRSASDHKPFFFPGRSYHTPEMQLAQEIKQKLPETCSIIVPPDVTGVRYFSKKSIFIDYKSNIHSKSYFRNAAKHRRALYGLRLEDRRNGLDVIAKGKEYYRSLTAEDLQPFKSQGATHFLTYSNHQLQLPKVAENSFFTVYQL